LRRRRISAFDWGKQRSKPPAPGSRAALRPRAERKAGQLLKEIAEAAERASAEATVITMARARALDMRPLPPQPWVHASWSGYSSFGAPASDPD
jgi:hypothetical protein